MGPTRGPRRCEGCKTRRTRAHGRARTQGCVGRPPIRAGTWLIHKARAVDSNSTCCALRRSARLETGARFGVRVGRPGALGKSSRSVGSELIRSCAQSFARCEARSRIPSREGHPRDRSRGLPVSQAKSGEALRSRVERTDRASQGCCRSSPNPPRGASGPLSRPSLRSCPRVRARGAGQSPAPRWRSVYQEILLPPTE